MGVGVWWEWPWKPRIERKVPCSHVSTRCGSQVHLKDTLRIFLAFNAHCQLQAMEACSPDQNDPFAFQVLWGECDQEHELVGRRNRSTLWKHSHYEKADRQKHRQLEKTRNRQESQVLQTYQEQTSIDIQPGMLTFLPCLTSLGPIRSWSMTSRSSFIHGRQKITSQALPVDSLDWAGVP